MLENTLFNLIPLLFVDYFCCDSFFLYNFGPRNH